MIVIVDYSMGNVGSIRRMLSKIGVESVLSRDPDEILAAEKLILPGVGAFDAGLERLDAFGLRRVLGKAVLEDLTPVLGICLGMQLLFERSEEGSRRGLGWMPGVVERFDFQKCGNGHKVPHMGWNRVQPRSGAALFASLDAQSRFYFVHSYFAKPKEETDIAAECNHGATFCCAVSRGNIHGAQFHPEKSHRYGLQLLKNFTSL